MIRIINYLKKQDVELVLVATPTALALILGALALKAQHRLELAEARLALSHIMCLIP